MSTLATTKHPMKHFSFVAVSPMPFANIDPQPLFGHEPANLTFNLFQKKLTKRECEKLQLTLQKRQEDQENRSVTAPTQTSDSNVQQKQKTNRGGINWEKLY